MSINDMCEEGTPPPLLLRHRLRIARERAQLEQEQLAAEIGVSRNTIGNAENGNVTPREITLKMIALATKVPVSYFFGAPDYSPPGRKGRRPNISQLPHLDSNQEPFGSRSTPVLALTG
jgi:transcriptional regulator with XRE-family HTH domain